MPPILHHRDLSHTHTHTLQACPFELEVFTEDCEGEIEIVDLLTFEPIIAPVLSQVVMERGVCEDVRDGREGLQTYTYTTQHMSTIVVENKVVSAPDPREKRQPGLQDCSLVTIAGFNKGVSAA